MRKPIYKWTLAVNGGAEVSVSPVYRDDLSKDFEKEGNEEFFRAKLNGKITFVRQDYEKVAREAFDTEFTIRLKISYDWGATWEEYWKGVFWKTNCDFDEDNKVLTFTPEVVDDYTEVLAGMEKEYNLIDLAPEIVPVSLDKRPMIQVYIPSQNVVGCFLSGMWWEESCEEVTSESDLLNKYFFAKVKEMRTVEVTAQTGSPALPDVFVGNAYDSEATGSTAYTTGGYTFERVYINTDAEVSETFNIRRASDNQILYQRRYGNEPPKTYPLEITLSAYSGSGASGSVTLYLSDTAVFARYVCDVEEALGLTTNKLRADDMVADNRNYGRAIGYNFPETIVFNADLSDTPTPWGLCKDGQYYKQPSGSWYFGEFFPVARNSWGRLSVWFVNSSLDFVTEKAFRAQFTLRDSYPLASVINVLLRQISPEITHEETPEYSTFLYGTNPFFGFVQRVMITPKSNVISLGYDQPAQRAMITLRGVLDMLRDCFRCYWWIDEDKRFRIEHIEYFRRGGSYTAQPTIGRDLTKEVVTRNGKPWAFDTSSYSYEKPEMASRYQFGWMDEVTALFEGNPMDIISKYVNADNIAQIEVSGYTSDIDYILLNPTEISKDGFVLLSAMQEEGVWRLPYLEFGIGASTQNLQNAYVSFAFLQRYYFYDMPAKVFTYNGEQRTALGVKRLKTQRLKFPALRDPNLLQLISTNLGNGEVQKISVNLSSRNAECTLRYDTE